MIEKSDSQFSLHIQEIFMLVFVPFFSTWVKNEWSSWLAPISDVHSVGFLFSWKLQKAKFVLAFFSFHKAYSLTVVPSRHLHCVLFKFPFQTWEDASNFLAIGLLHDEWWLMSIDCGEFFIIIFFPIASKSSILNDSNECLKMILEQRWHTVYSPRCTLASLLVLYLVNNTCEKWILLKLIVCRTCFKCVFYIILGVIRTWFCLHVRLFQCFHSPPSIYQVFLTSFSL